MKYVMDGVTVGLQSLRDVNNEDESGRQQTESRRWLSDT
jgi:hypothetical protein